MRRFMVLVTVALVMTAMLVFAGPAFAQGACQDFGNAVGGFAQEFKPFGKNVISGFAPVNELVLIDQEFHCE